jgi:hypothetical protein
MNGPEFSHLGTASYRVHDGVQLDTLRSLAEWEVLGGECGKCGRIGWTDKRAILRKQENQYLFNLRGKLKCVCGHRGGEVVIGTLDRNV